VTPLPGRPPTAAARHHFFRRLAALCVLHRRGDSLPPASGDLCHSIDLVLLLALEDNHKEGAPA
jgi:hypothetical protein